jgi:hypothetical protein
VAIANLVTISGSVDFIIELRAGLLLYILASIFSPGFTLTNSQPVAVLTVWFSLVQDRFCGLNAPSKTLPKDDSALRKRKKKLSEIFQKILYDLSFSPGSEYQSLKLS